MIIIVKTFEYQVGSPAAAKEEGEGRGGGWGGGWREKGGAIEVDDGDDHSKSLIKV